MEITFINADLEITATEPLDVIRDAFVIYGHRFFLIHFGEIGPDEHFASFEMKFSDGDEDESLVTARQNIEAFCDAIDGFYTGVRALWDRSKKRVMDLGYQAGNHCAPLHDVDSLSRLSSLGIHLAITIYPEAIVHELRGN
jgi:hypothetical protein